MVQYVHLYAQLTVEFVHQDLALNAFQDMFYQVAFAQNAQLLVLNAQVQLFANYAILDTTSQLQEHAQ